MRHVCAGAIVRTNRRGWDFLLRKFRILDGNNPERSREILHSIFGPVAFDPIERSENFGVTASYLRLSKTAIVYAHYHSAVSAIFPEKPGIRQQIVLTGRSETYRGNRPIDVTSEQSCIIPPSSVFKKRMYPQTRQLVLTIDVPALQQFCRASCGYDLPIVSDVQPVANFSSLEGQRLLRLVTFIASEADQLGAQLPDVVSSELEDAMLAAFLLANPNSYGRVFNRKTADLSPRSVRIAEEYIRANWHQAITVVQLAAVSGCSARSLFRFFQQYRGYTPMVFLKNIRLDRARERLENPGLNTSVTGIALACGFHNPGHFAKDYFRRFGELPSQTLWRGVHSAL